MIAGGVALFRAIFYKPVLLERFGYYTWFFADGLSMGAFLALIVRILFQNNRLGAALSLTLTNFFFFILLATAPWIGSGQYKRWANFSLLKFFGYISYRLYLIHWLVLDRFDALVNAFRPETFPATGQPGLVLIRFVSAGAIATLVAYMFRRYLEDPIRKIRISSAHR